MHSAVQLPHVTLDQCTMNHSLDFPIQLQLYCMLSFPNLKKWLNVLYTNCLDWTAVLREIQMYQCTCMYQPNQNVLPISVLCSSKHRGHRDIGKRKVGCNELRQLRWVIWQWGCRLNWASGVFSMESNHHVFLISILLYKCLHNAQAPMTHLHPRWTVFIKIKFWKWNVQIHGNLK